MSVPSTALPDSPLGPLGPSRKTLNLPIDLGGALVDMSRDCKSWRERLQWVRDRFADPAFAPTPGDLGTLAVYLRFLATGEVKCEEDGRHFRPNHHAEAALQIEAALERLSGPDTAWILRQIYPCLPSSGEELRRAEPLTRIRDIAHRNDIPDDLKQRDQDPAAEQAAPLRRAGGLARLCRDSGPRHRSGDQLLARVRR